jgi:hypothetical protein
MASVADMKVQHVAAKRERSKSLALHKAAVQHKSSDFERVPKKTSNEHPVKRRRKLQDMSPGLVRPASRRLDDEFEEIPSKRVRCNFNDVSLVQGDGRSQEHHNLLLTNFEATKYTAGFSPYDISNRGDVLQSPEYVSDIFQRLYQSEVGAMRKIPIFVHALPNLNISFSSTVSNGSAMLHAQSTMRNTLDESNSS